jgi:beta-galactosidase
VIEASTTRMRLALTSKMDPTLYDEPLTLKTAVPADWKNCLVTQGVTKATVAAADGALVYTAVPGGAEIVIQPARR